MIKRNKRFKIGYESVHKVIHFNQNAWLKPYIDMNTDLTKKAKNYFMKNAVFGKTMENVRRHRDIKLVTTVRRRNHLISQPSYHSRELFTKNLLAKQMKKNWNTHEPNLSG